jgi:MATE family multidrug resistance protein
VLESSEEGSSRNSVNSKPIAWEHRSFAELGRLSWPIAISTLSYSVMTLVDTLLVGHLGAPELAGVGLAGTTAFVVLCFSFGLLRGVKTLVAQAIGAHRPREVEAYRAAILIAVGVLGVASIAVGQLLAFALPLIAASKAAGAHAQTYLTIRNLGAPMALLYVGLREVRYGEGDSFSPMFATVIANVVNIALASWFIYGLKWGVAGAAWATVIAHGVEAAVVIVAGELRGARWGLDAVERRHLRELWRVGLPTGIQFSLEVGAFACLAAMVSAMSEVQMAAHQIALQVIHFSFLPAFAVAEAGSVLAGQAVGANRDDLVRKVARQALLAASIYTGACTIVFIVAAPLIVRGFTSDPMLGTTAVSLLHVAAVFQVFDGANIVARATLRGTGDVRFPAVFGVLTAWALTPPLTWLLGWKMGLGAYGGWLGLCVEIIAGSLVYWWRIENGGWASSAARSREQLAMVAAA